MFSERYTQLSIFFFLVNEFDGCFVIFQFPSAIGSPSSDPCLSLYHTQVLASHTPTINGYLGIIGDSDYILEIYIFSPPVWLFQEYFKLRRFIGYEISCIVLAPRSRAYQIITPLNSLSVELISNYRSLRLISNNVHFQSVPFS